MVTLAEIKELQQYLETFRWGFFYKNKYINNDFSNYRTIPPQEFLDNQCGVCWDYVNYEANWFEEHGFTNTINDINNGEYDMLYLESQDKEEIPTHTWIMFGINNALYSFEASWKNHATIKQWQSEEDCINAYCKWFCSEESVNNVNVYKYINFKIYNQLCDDFMLYCKTTGKQIR